MSSGAKYLGLDSLNPKTSYHKSWNHEHNCWNYQVTFLSLKKLRGSTATDAPVKFRNDVMIQAQSRDFETFRDLTRVSTVTMAVPPLPVTSDSKRGDLFRDKYVCA